MADVVVTCTVSPCVITHQIDLPPLQLDVAGGAQIAGAILAVWAVGWAFRALLRLINDGDSSTNESEK